MLSFSRMEEQEHQQWPQILSPCSSSSSTSRRRSNDSNSPEFEFWMVRNPSCPQPDLHSADELFSHGILLPLHLLHHHQQPPSIQRTNPAPPPAITTTTTTTTTTPQEEEKEAEPPLGADRPEPGPDAATDSTNLAAASAFTSKRWKDIIFKRSDRKSSRNGEGVDDNSKEKETVKKKEKKKMSTANITGGVGNSGVTAAELNINIWPFRRSRSAGNGGSRPRMAASAAATRKVSSAPCSRSNSAGESKSRKWPSSPSRGGVHLGRSSPVWQVRRGSGAPGATAAAGGRSSEAALKSAEKGVRKEGNESRRKNAVHGGAAAAGGGGSGQRARVLNLNVPMCIGYRHQLSCRSDENSAICVAASAAAGGGDGGGSGQRGGAASGEGVRGSNLFNIRGLFTKKVH